MDISRSRRHRSGLLASLAAVVLFLGSVVFAAAASAEPGPSGPTHPAQAQGPKTTAPGQGTTKAHHGRATGQTTRSGSSVSLAKPNGFQAQADPDGMTNGGVDQPGGTGGVDTSAQDGNNGSGNDADCEDDNRGVGIPGHCKVRTDQGQEQTGDQTDIPVDTTVDSPVLPAAQVPVLTPTFPGLTTTQVSAPGGDSSIFTRDHAVAGISTTSTAAQAAPRPTAGILPNTGAGAALLALTLGGLAALATGGGLLRRARTTA